MLSWLFRIWLLFVVIILLAGVGLAYGEWQEVRQEYSTDLHALAAAMADGTQLFLQGAQTSLSMLAQDADRTANITSLLLHEKLQDYLVLNPDFDSVGLKTADNTVITSGMNKDLLHTLLSPVATHKNFFLTTQQ
ncbi:hypothetical protein HF669_00400 [Acidithiobacillus thiooxidans]|nr:hypothetical protein [Acidithiobacillus thiooxidans]MBU2794389.1 hypothetical protein [Acidithiobacillus thiooxidans]MBU2809869.1 hypothetical protein [Acidithiobacillus thiooxidans]